MSNRVKIKESTLPMRVHKNLLVRALHMCAPGEVPTLCLDYPPTEDGKAAAIAAVEEHPGTWIVGGELLTPEKWREIAHRYGETGD